MLVEGGGVPRGPVGAGRHPGTGEEGSAAHLRTDRWARGEGHGCSSYGESGGWEGLAQKDRSQGE